MVLVSVCDKDAGPDFPVFRRRIHRYYDMYSVTMPIRTVATAVKKMLLQWSFWMCQLPVYNRCFLSWVISPFCVACIAVQPVMK
jgi:hypothetical protein